MLLPILTALFFCQGGELIAAYGNNICWHVVILDKETSVETTHIVTTTIYQIEHNKNLFEQKIISHQFSLCEPLLYFYSNKPDKTLICAPRKHP